ncbi:restriction endonuclease subunit S [Mycoplasma struthionis]|uniref:Restriction endonuclease subunit S n=1 Tax=Mycoplasma struthionis TaxID=538220 RepID=A0A502M3E7_9MOLU|nr:restriction endonuclease subunit S [Mycoplasma struthionis]
MLLDFKDKKEAASNPVSFKIKDICLISRGVVISKKIIFENQGIYPVYSSQTVNDGILGYINKFSHEGEYITWTTDGAYAGSVFYRNGKFNITNVCGILEVKDKNLVNVKYLSYVLSKNAKKYVNTGMGNPKLMSNTMSEIEVLIPDIKTQEKIVYILENFEKICEDLIIGLPAEIEGRKKQFEYYRDLLINFSQEREREREDYSIEEIKLIQFAFGFLTIKLQNIIYINIGKQLNKDKLLPLGAYAVINGGVEPSGYWNNFNYTKDKITISQGGASAGFVSWQDKNFWAGAHCYIVFDKNKLINYKYLYHFLKNKENFLMNNQHGAGIPALSKEIIYDIEIDLPTLEKQNEIVSILDKFETLCNDLNKGLPAEIAYRKQQYDYYLNLLLKFEK